MPVEVPKRVWALLGPHRGDNNQVLALAEVLGLPFETKSLRYNQWRRLQPRLLGATLRSLTPGSRATVAGDPPDLTISTGHRSVPVVQELRRRSGGRTRSVHVGNPRLSPAHFDLVVPTPEYPVPDHPNVLRVPFALTREKPVLAPDPGAAWLETYPAPRRLLAIGGPTLNWSLDKGGVLDALADLLAAAAQDGGSVLVVGSPRTPKEVLRAVREALAGARVPAMLVPNDGRPSYPELLAAADTIFVTADSVAMVADAVMTGKPVGLVPIRSTPLGRAYMGLMDRLRPGRRVHPRDLRFFWAALEDNALVGTLEQPHVGAVPDLAADIARRVRELLNEPVPPLLAG
jgi:mitochondrial fission protein ELM1